MCQSMSTDLCMYLLLWQGINFNSPVSFCAFSVSALNTSSVSKSWDHIFHQLCQDDNFYCHTWGLFLSIYYFRIFHRSHMLPVGPSKWNKWARSWNWKWGPQKQSNKIRNKNFTIPKIHIEKPLFAYQKIKTEHSTYNISPHELISAIKKACHIIKQSFLLIYLVL